MLSVGNVLPVEGIVAAYPSLLAKLKLSCLCALLRGPKSTHGWRCNSCLPFFTSEIKDNLIFFSFFPPFSLLPSFPSLYPTSLCLTFHYLTFYYLTFNYLTFYYPTSLYLTSPYLTFLYLTSLYLTSLYLISQGVLVKHFRG
jgi:hypothetical protein